MNSPINQAQILLHRWLSHFDKKSYQSIKEACEYLNVSMHLGIPGNPMWKLFYPLMRIGVIDCAGDDNYAIAPSVVLDFDTHLYIINSDLDYTSQHIGYKFIDGHQTTEYNNVVKLSTLAVLKSFPTIRDIVYSWKDSLQDESILKYYNNKKKVGMAKLETGLSKYFVIPSECIIKEVPSRRVNPDAFNIGITYERAINSDGNGIYDLSSQKLKMPLFGLPTLLHRTLMIDGLYKQQFPNVGDDYVIFHNLSKATIKELNRILCNSISYE